MGETQGYNPPPDIDRRTALKKIAQLAGGVFASAALGSVDSSGNKEQHIATRPVVVSAEQNKTDKMIEKTPKNPEQKEEQKQPETFFNLKVINFFSEEVVNLIEFYVSKIEDPVKKEEEKEKLMRILAKQLQDNEDTLRANKFHDEYHVDKYQKDILKYRKRIKKAIEKASEDTGVPKEILWSIMCLESGGNPRALSPSGATYGPFQLAQRVSTTYGLTIDDEIDERSSFMRSARVAAKYLKRLYGMFGEQWGLAVIGYNKGEGNLDNALGRMGIKLKKSKHYTKEELAKRRVNASSVIKNNPGWEYAIRVEICGDICAQASEKLIAEESIVEEDVKNPSK
jgi:hypothetical protein